MAPRSRWTTVIVAGVAVAALGTWADATLVLTAWADCDVGVNARANLASFVLFQAPVTFAGALAAFVIGTRAVRPLPTPAALAVGLVLAAAVLYVHLALVATPADYPDPLCPGNVPPWWPRWLPS